MASRRNNISKASRDRKNPSERLIAQLARAKVRVQAGTEGDAINPDYYQGDVELIDAQEAALSGLNGFEGYLVGQVMKYIWRWKQKNGLQDLEKADWYLQRLRKYVKKKKCR